MEFRSLIRAAMLSIAISTAAAAQTFTLNFDDTDLRGLATDGLVLGSVTLRNPTGTAFVLPTSFGCSALVCLGVVQGQVSGTLGFLFAGPVSSLQFGLVRAENRQSFLTLYDISGSVIATQNIIPDPTVGGFFGTTFSWTASGTAAYSVTLTHSFDAAQDFEAFELDNVTGTMMTPVPEPATAALVGVGMVGLLIARRRRA